MSEGAPWLDFDDSVAQLALGLHDDWSEEDDD